MFAPVDPPAQKRSNMDGNKTIRNKKLLETSASLLVTGALLVVQEAIRNKCIAIEHGWKQTLRIWKRPRRTWAP